MTEKVSLAFRYRNPDILTSIANLSNDEVFTPPEFANRMLDSLESAWAASNDGEIIWSNSKVTFLDPFTKSGVFLREIVRRLVDGLEGEIPNLQERVDHVVSKQVFGIAITELTSLLARRSVYCSKFADGEHSIATTFSTPEGNIWFEPKDHAWAGSKTKILVADDHGDSVEKGIDGRCSFCGANQKEYDRASLLERHAYALIHAPSPEKLIHDAFGTQMKFDVIIGNPPYQLSDGGHSASATSIYHLFVQQAKKLEPRFLSMVIPARWFTGGKGVDSFREEMIGDTRIRLLEDFPDSNDVFPGTQIKGGVCYFLWDRDNPGLAKINNHLSSGEIVNSERFLKLASADVFVRYNQAMPILEKVLKRETASGSTTEPESGAFSSLVSSAKPFGFRTFFMGKVSAFDGAVKIYRNGGVGWVARDEVEKNAELIDEWKVFLPALGSGSDSFPHPILGKPFVGEPGSVCSETYNCIGPFSSKAVAENVMSYISTKFFRFLVLLHKSSQHANRGVYAFVPQQDFEKSWADVDLYEKYDLDSNDVAFIESMIRPMELSDVS